MPVIGATKSITKNTGRRATIGEGYMIDRPFAIDDTNWYAGQARSQRTNKRLRLSGVVKMRLIEQQIADTVERHG